MSASKSLIAVAQGLFGIRGAGGASAWPGVRRAGLPRQSPALTPGRGAAGAALIKYG